MTPRITHPAARTGLKGPGAAHLLESQAITLPGPNQYVLRELPAHGLLRILRLGNTEFLLEQEGGSDAIESILAAATGTRAHLAPRCDFCVVLGGDGLYRRLSSLCAYDFAELENNPRKVVMTLLAGISVIFAVEPTADGQPALRLWCDPGYGTYLTHCLAHPGENR